MDTKTVKEDNPRWCFKRDMTAWELTEKSTASSSENMWGWARRGGTCGWRVVHGRNAIMTLAVEKWVDQGVSGDMDKVWRSTLKEEESKKRKDGRGRKTSKRLWYMHGSGLSVELEASPRESSELIC